MDRTDPSIIICQNSSCRKSAFLHYCHITIDGALWRVPLYLCHEDKCLVAAKAILVFNKEEVAKIVSKDATGDHNGPLVSKES